MTRSKTPFEPHLVIERATVARGTEWSPRPHRWCVLRLESGVGYWQRPEEAREISIGATLVFAGEIGGALRASQLNDLEIAYFYVDPDQLLGLLSLGELNQLRQNALREIPTLRILPSTDLLSERFGQFCRERSEGAFSARLKLLQLFFEFFSEPGLGGSSPRLPTQELDGRERLRLSLTQMAASEFVALSLADLAPRMRCSPRHLSRLFRQELGISFRKKQNEMRLAKARQLLVSSNAKVIEVAFTSGYQSYSLFALLFKKRFGMSPAKWRQQYARKTGRKSIPLAPL